jgi:hypothetical protein
MAAYLISIALAGLIAIAVREGLLRGFPGYLAAPQPQINFNSQRKTRNAYIMPGLVPGTDILLARAEDVDGRDKPCHAKAHKQAPVLGPVDAPFGIDRNSNGPSMIVLRTKIPANQHPGMCHPETNSGSRQTKRLNRSGA